MRCVTTLPEPLTNGLCGMGRHDWGNIHLRIVLPVLLLLHVILHWGVIKVFVCGRVARGAE